MVDEIGIHTKFSFLDGLIHGSQRKDSPSFNVNYCYTDDFIVFNKKKL